MMMAEHEGQIDALAPLDEMTHVAVRDGAWSDPSTWENGVVPESKLRELGIDEGALAF